MEETYVKLFTKFLQWEWYDDANTMRLFLHLLLKAGIRDKRWHGLEVQRGTLLTSRTQLAEELHLTPQEIRTCLSRLESTNEITKQSTKTGTLITICKYDNYNCSENSNNQAVNQTINQASTNLQPSINQSQQPKQQEVILGLEEGINQPDSFPDINIDIHSTIHSTNIEKEINKEKEKRKRKSQKEIQADLEKRKRVFYESLIPYVEEFGKEMVREFYDYWVEPNKSGTKFRKESESHWDLHRRLLTWQRNNEKKQYGNNTKGTDSSRRRGMEVIATCIEDYGDL